jgi:hypothetical protein
MTAFFTSYWRYFSWGGAALGAALSLLLLLRLHKKVVQWSKDDKWLADEFRRCNVIVFGKKGSGKDLLFAHVIYLRNELHYSNICYNELTELRSLKDLLLGDNTFIDFVEDSITKSDPIFEEQKDFYISDGGVFLPSQFHREINEIYPSMPIYFALSRHLYNSNVHVNVQHLTRIWDKLREQADSYIRTLKTEDKGDYLIVNAITYDRYESAVSGLLPCNDKQYQSTNGEITERRFKVFKHELEYDTRYFKGVFLNAPKTYYEEVMSHVQR